MSVENVKKFYEAVAQDEALKQKFVALSQKYLGQPMDEAKVIAIMEQEALPIAKQMGYSFSIEELKAYGTEIEASTTNLELSDAELATVTGGGTYMGFCFICGIVTHTWDNGQDIMCIGGFCLGPGQPM